MVFENPRFLHTTADVSKAWAEQIQAERKVRRRHPVGARPGATMFGAVPPHHTHARPAGHRNTQGLSQDSASSRGTSVHSSDTSTASLPGAVDDIHSVSGSSCSYTGNCAVRGGGPGREDAARREVETQILNSKINRVSSQMKDVQRELKHSSYENKKLVQVIRGLKRRMQALGTSGQPGSGTYGRPRADESTFAETLTETATSFAPSQQDTATRASSVRGLPRPSSNPLLNRPPSSGGSRPSPIS